MKVVLKDLPPREQKYWRVRLCSIYDEEWGIKDWYVDQMGKVYTMLQCIMHDNWSNMYVYWPLSNVLLWTH